jgi:PAS domain S-box-containing protein
VEVRDDFLDSIGLLTRNFNQMIRSMRDRIEYANSLKMGISDPFFMVDSEMRLTHLNHAAAELMGVRPEDVHGTMSCEALFGRSACEMSYPVKKAMETGVPTVAQRVTLMGGGREIHVMASAAALKDSTGKVLGGFEIMRDISKEVEAGILLQASYLKEEKAKKDLLERVGILSGILTKVAEGDLTVRAELSERNDAMDQLAKKTNETLDRMEALISQTKNAALTVVKGIHHIAEENQSFAQRTGEQAAAMEEIRATVEELISHVRQNTSSTQRAESLSREAVAVARESGSTVERTAEAMADMTQASRKIVEMMDLISEITFQTNLLSINAAVEAARAGEHGRGFAVVANEVRNLAKKSSEASKGIRDLVRDIQEKVSSSRNWVGELEQGFEKITLTIRQASEAQTEVLLASQESSEGLNQIGEGVREMSDAIELNASLVDDLAGVAEHFNEKASLLQNMAERFRIRGQEIPEAEVPVVSTPLSKNRMRKFEIKTFEERQVPTNHSGRQSVERGWEDFCRKDMKEDFEEF